VFSRPDNQGSDTTLNNNTASEPEARKQERGAEYLTARIARDAPEVLERMKAGEFTSVRAAAIAAGVVTPKTPMQRIEALADSSSHPLDAFSSDRPSDSATAARHRAEQRSNSSDGALWRVSKR
jgi:hypothetical protein